MLEEQTADNGGVFDNLDGKFLARLREISSNTRTTADGKATITFKTARIEANYSPDIIKKIEAGRLVAIPNVLGVNSKDNYSIYEVADVYPMHYSMLTLDRNQPGAIRKEFMSLIEKEWQQGSKNTWIEIVAAPTGYTLQLVADRREPNFIRKNIAPLTGSEVSLLSDETIKKFICYTPKDTKLVEHFTLGHLLGATDNQIPFTVNIEKLIHYHVGAFAFTGSGKSNLTSLVIRKAMNAVPNVKFVIFDISSEYGINILDLLRLHPSRVVFTEPLPVRDNDGSSSSNNTKALDLVKNRSEDIQLYIRKFLQKLGVDESYIPREAAEAATNVLDFLAQEIELNGDTRKRITWSFIASRDAHKYRELEAKFRTAYDEIENFQINSQKAKAEIKANLDGLLSSLNTLGNEYSNFVSSLSNKVKV